jgi:hypothetical protein
VTPPWEELFCFLIVSVYVVGLLPRPSDARRWALGAYVIVALAGWLGEETCIRAYGFYAYSPGWKLWLGVVPLAVVLVWPVVILSALELAKSLRASSPAWLCATVVLADAALIEPVAVRSGLWHWTEPGLFEVPLVGILGWAFFALAAAAWLEGTRARPRAALALVVVAPLACHALLLASWWGALRWVSGPLPDWAGPAAAWPLSLAVTALVLRPSVTGSLGLLLARLPGALMFFVLLALRGRDDFLLVAYVAAFAVPYLALTARAWLGRHAEEGEPRCPAAG